MFVSPSLSVFYIVFFSYSVGYTTECKTLVSPSLCMFYIVLGILLGVSNRSLPLFVCFI